MGMENLVPILIVAHQLVHFYSSSARGERPSSSEDCFQSHRFLLIMFNFRIVPSVLFASVLVSSVGLNANAQTKAPSIDSGIFSIEGFEFKLYNTWVSYGRGLWWQWFIDEDREYRFSLLRSYDDIEFTEEELLVNYSNHEGFKGLYSWEGVSEEITTDVSVDVNFGRRLENGEIGAHVKGYIGKDRKNLVFGGLAFGDLLFGADDFGHIEFSGYFDPSVSKKVHERFILEKFEFSNGQSHNVYYAPDYPDYTDTSADYKTLMHKPVIFKFSQDSDNTDYPTYIQGGISTLISKNNTFDDDNALVGVFVAKASETDPINPFNNAPYNTPEPVTPTEPTVEEPDLIVEDEELSWPKGSRQTEYTPEEITRLGIPQKLLDEDDTKIGLKRTTTDGELSRENHVSPIRYANPTFQLWEIGEGRRSEISIPFTDKALVRDNTPKGTYSCGVDHICTTEISSLIYGAGFDNYFENLKEASPDEKKIWKKEVTTAISKGYLQWIQHLDNFPGHLDIETDDKRERSYNTKSDAGEGDHIIHDFVNSVAAEVTDHVGKRIGKQIGKQAIKYSTTGAAVEALERLGGEYANLLPKIGESSPKALKALGSAAKITGAITRAAITSTGVGLALDTILELGLPKATKEERTLFSEKWLEGLRKEYNNNNKDEVRQKLIAEATRLAGDEFGFMYVSDNPYRPLYHSNNVGSVMNKENDYSDCPSDPCSRNVGVTKRDIERIPDSTYKNNYETDFPIYRQKQLRGRIGRGRTITPPTHIFRYGAWLTHGFKIEGVHTKGESDDEPLYFKETDMITASPYFVFNKGEYDQSLPTVSATYSGEENFLGVDMSAHFLGAVLKADAEVGYTFVENGSTATVTIDNFQVFTGENFSNGNAYKNMIDSEWTNLGGSLTYELSCGDNSCSTPDELTAQLNFIDNAKNVGGTISDRHNQYVGAFLADKE